VAKGKRKHEEPAEVEVGEEELPRALPAAAAAALVFVAAGAVLMLEILAVRLLAPYVGLTLETTTSIIGAALGGIAVGAAVGGYLADRTETRRLIVALLIGGGMLTLLTVPLVRWLGPGARGDGDLAALGLTLVALVPAAAVLSAVSPAVAHLQLRDLRASGTVVGGLSAWATAGALVGTFGTGFVIVPLLPVGTAVLIIGLVLILVGIGLATSTGTLAAAPLAAMAIAAASLGLLSASADSPCERETDYHCASLEAEPTSAGPGHHLLLDNDHQSYVSTGNPKILAYRYTRWIAEVINRAEPGRRPLGAVFVGGGGFTLPRWLQATRPGSNSLVLEVDGELVRFVEDRLDLRTSPDLRVAVGDARTEMLSVPQDSADVVVGDAFSGLTVPWHLTTAEWMEEVKRVLEPDGLYVVNIIDEPPLGFLRSEVATLLDSFAAVRMVSYVGESGEPLGGNAVLIASEQPLPPGVGSTAVGATTFTEAEVEAFAAGADVLRDDYAPVDQLLTLNR
jgi:MFS family permease